MKSLKKSSSATKKLPDIHKNIFSPKKVSDLNETPNDLRKTIGRQKEKIATQVVQIQKGSDNQVRLDEQILILTKAMESATDGIFIINAQKPFFPVIYSNPSFQQMTGYSQREVLGKNYFLLYGAEADARIVEEIRHTILQGRSFYGEMLNFRKNGEKYWNLLRITAVRDNLGIVTHYVGIQTDVTLIRQRDIDIKEKHEELLHVTRVGKLAEFVSSLAHEISQPLTAILSYAQAAQRLRGAGDPQLQEILQYIIDDDTRATEVIRRLRSLLKKSEPEVKKLDMNALITDTIALVAADVTARHNILRTSLADNLPFVCVDRIQLQQVLLNLISNSFDAMESNRDSRFMMIMTSRKDKDTVQVSVKDSGCGIKPKDIPKLFTHFFTSKPNGLGMGLSISRSIIEAHGGRIEIKNNSDRGATISFTLPVDRTETI